jgi:ubiquinone biosynthesis protein
VKLGQILSTRADLLPPAFITCLSRLQDQVPPFPIDDVRRILGAAWGEPADEVLARRFKRFDETPLASASMAQVHTAVLPDGREVVVKVQRPGIDDAVTRDSELLVVIAQLLERVVEEARTYRAVDLVTEFKDALHGELDFRREAKNLEAFARANAGRAGVHVPFLVPELSGRTVLVMERIHGVRITELASQPERAQRVVERLIEVAFDHAFVDGLFHGDPHPGNILVDEHDNIAFIDFGLVGQVARELQDRLIMLLIALSVRDVDTTARLVMRVGDVEGRVAIAPFRGAVSRLMDRYFGLSIEDLPTAALFSDLAILSKASVSIDGIVRALHPRFDPSRTIGARAEQLLRERIDPRNLQGGGLKSALQLAFVVQELPVQLGQVLLDFERGQVQVAVRSEALDTLNTTLRGMSMSIFGGILAGALVLAGFVTLDVAGLTEARAGLLAMLAFGAAGGLFGVAFAWYITGGRLPRVTLRRLLGNRLQRLRDDVGTAGPGSP